MITVIFILLWTVPAFIIAYGLSFAYWQGKFPTLAVSQYNQDIVDSLFFASIACCLGPLGIILVLISFSGYGFKFK